MGWRSNTFNWYDIKKAKKRLNPQLKGGQFASNNQTVNAKICTADEKSYLADVNHYIKKLNEYVTKSSTEMKKEINTTIKEQENENTSFEKLNRFFREKASSINDAFVHEEETNQERRIDLRNELNNFRLANGLTKREAYYPTSYILHFSWIFVFIFIEALINAYFFGEASSLGLLGGVFIGFITSFINVTVSTISGFVLRYKNHISLFKKSLGILSFSLLLMIISFIHLFIAHYREILTRNPNIEIQSVIEPLLANPFALHDMESLILIIIGVLVSLFSIFKGLSLDDGYPAYGKVYRRWKAKEDEFLSSKKQARLLMRELYSVSLRKSDTIIEYLQKSKKMMKDLNYDIDSFLNSCNLYHQRAVESAKELLSSYRDGAAFVYADALEFKYHDDLLSGDCTLSPLESEILLESKRLINNTLDNINQEIIDFQNNQKTFEEKLETMKNDYLNDESIEKILHQIKRNREIEL